MRAGCEDWPVRGRVTEVASYDCVGGPFDGAVLTPPAGSVHPVLVMRGQDHAYRPTYRPVSWPLSEGAVVGRYVLQAYRGATRRAVWEPMR
jgi:hypothetical protein